MTVAIAFGIGYLVGFATAAVLAAGGRDDD